MRELRAVSLPDIRTLGEPRMIGVHSHRLVLESRFERIVHARAQALLASQHRAGCGAESGDCDDSLVTPRGTDPEQSFAASLSTLPAAAYTTDAAGRITVTTRLPPSFGGGARNSGKIAGAARGSSTRKTGNRCRTRCAPWQQH
jgi:hypothetical protein